MPAPETQAESTPAKTDLPRTTLTARPPVVHRQAEQPVTESVELPDADNYQLRVIVDGVSPSASVCAALFDGAETFPDRSRAQRVATTAAQESSQQATIIFDRLSSGKYAVAVFVDENRDGVLNKNALGIPAEPYGFSRNAKGRFGPPSFDAAKVDMNDDLEIRIQLD